MYTGIPEFLDRETRKAGIFMEFPSFLVFFRLPTVFPGKNKANPTPICLCSRIQLFRSFWTLERAGLAFPCIFCHF